MSNCDVGSGECRSPGYVVAQHCIQCCDHLPHDCDDDDLGFFVCRGKAVMESLESWVVPTGAEGCHVEHVADRQAPAVDAAMSFKLAAVKVVGCEADQGGDLLAAHLAELRQQGDQCEGQHRADARHGSQQLITLSENGVCGDHLGHALVEQTDIGLQPRQTALVE